MSTSSNAFGPRYHRARFFMPVLLLLLGMAVSLGLNTTVYNIRGKYVDETVSEFGQLPSSVLQATGLEFNGVIADYLLFRTLTYMGLRIQQQKSPSAEEWQVIHQMLQRVTDLDPRFWDPYLFAETTLAWEARMIDEVNVLLEKAAKHRPHDYFPHNFIGFNYLFFKNDPKKAAPHFRKASQLPGAPEYIKILAARVSLYAGETGTGIFFLENMIKEIKDPIILKRLEELALGLKMVFFLEGKVKEFKAQYNRLPETLDELVTSGFIDEMPVDPYGGQFVLLKNGRVFTTSELHHKIEEKK